MKFKIDYEPSLTFFVTSYEIVEVERELEINIEYSTNDGNTWASTIYDDQYYDFLEYLKNPKIYQATKKYNL